ncbi:MAG: CHAT domain-containing protein, partial [Bacteroidota bacterium]
KESPYQVLHISSHAQLHVTSPDASYIALADTLISVAGIQAIHLPAELVVLSACETGRGQHQKGEGVLSVGRAFHEAGAQSSLTTLWQVEDPATSQIMVQFYHLLSKGMDKTQALQQARLDYIAQSGESLAHPFFWSAWVFMGDERPLETSPVIPWTVWLFAGIGVLGLGWSWGRRRSRRK